MKAYEIKEAIGIKGIVLNLDRQMPQPGHWEIKVRVRAASLNFRDLLIAKGGYRGGSKPSVIPLSDGAGEVVDVGPSVSRFKVEIGLLAHFSRDGLPARSRPTGLRVLLVARSTAC